MVSNASALIALEDIGLLDRVAPILSECVIPPAVEREIAPTVRRRNWIEVRPLSRAIESRVVRASLDPGETETIGLALELGTHHVVLDERPARTVAANLGLPVIGAIGILVLAKQSGILPVVRPHLESLRATGFFVSEPLFEHALAIADETG
ncbi:MAG: DUF3368 domain-containing protein [Thermomicrobiales bacterium]